jgi:hypothetical protein
MCGRRRVWAQRIPRTRPTPYWHEGISVPARGEIDTGQVRNAVGIVEASGVLELDAEGFDKGAGQQGTAVFVAFAFADGDFAAVEVHILDSESEALHESQARAVEETCHEVVSSRELSEGGTGLFGGENGG